MLTVHHLRRSQSERIVLAVRGARPRLRAQVLRPQQDQTCWQPAEYKALHHMGIAPVITDGDLRARRIGRDRRVHPRRSTVPVAWRAGLQDPDFARYLYWLHFANGTLQPIMGRT